MNTQRSLGFSTLRGNEGARSGKFLPAALTIVILAATVGNLSAATCHDVFPFYAGPPGSSPNGKALLVAPNKVFGTTYYGGDSNYGVVYELTYDKVSGTFSETVLYSFKGLQDGGNPAAGLKMDGTGALYGTAATSNNGRQVGVVFRLTPTGDGTYSYGVIHEFGGSLAGGVVDGTYPNSDLTFGPKGEIYGTTVFGGQFNQGTVFQLCPPSLKIPLCPAQVPGQGWPASVLYAFTGGADGAQPYVGLAIDSKFNLYGAAYSGGISEFGTVFELSPPTGGSTAWTENTLYKFKGAPNDGFNPLGGVALTNHNSLIGTTYLGGNGGTAPNTVAGGVIFELSLSTLTETVLNNFIGANGANPSDTLVLDNMGNFYGSTGGAQAGLQGSVFKLTPVGHSGYHINVVYTFSGAPDGEAPLPSIAQATSGAIFGTTFYGGLGGAGSIFEIDDNPQPFPFCE